MKSYLTKSVLIFFAKCLTEMLVRREWIKTKKNLIDFPICVIFQKILQNVEKLQL